MPGFWENVLDSFSYFYIEFANSNFSFSGAYTHFQQNDHIPGLKPGIKPPEFISSNKARIMNYKKCRQSQIKVLKNKYQSL